MPLRIYRSPLRIAVSMLCRVCASIDLKDAFGPDPAEPGEPLLEKHTFSPRIPHYESFAAMLAAAEYCELCAVVVKGLNSIVGNGGYYGYDSMPIYRSFERVKDGKDLLPGQPKHLTVMNFGGEYHAMNYEVDFYGVELYVQEGTKLAVSQDIIGRPIGAADDPTLPMKWFNECNKSHSKCRLSSLGELQTFMPTRVIEVGSQDLSRLRLRNSGMCSGSYATLSHCWGTTVRTRLSKDNVQQYMTGFDMSTLCKTMQEAVIITRNLQLKYLWIDALCIIQDDPEDWEREALKMSEVYTQSAITIAASSSINGDSGCFYPRPEGPTAQLRWTISTQDPPEMVNFRGHEYTRYHDMVNDAPLNKRAWVMQERSLSRRIIHFTSDRLFWECQEITLEEGFAEVTSSPGVFVRGFQIASNHVKVRSAEDIHWMTAQWNSIVERYTLCKLTYKSDRLPALAGVAKVWSRASNDRYIAGCWQGSLPLSLLWTEQVHVKTENSGSNHIHQYPSWSWASFDGAVYFPDKTITTSKEMISMIKEVIVTIDGSAEDTLYGNINEGLLTLTGRVKSTVFEGDRTDNEYDQHMPWTMQLDAKRRYVHNRASFDGSPIPLLQLCKHETEWEYMEAVMLLQPLQQLNHFRRLGLGIITWKKASLDKVDTIPDDGLYQGSWFNDVPAVRLTIR